MGKKVREGILGIFVCMEHPTNGRIRWAFNLTLFITGVFALAAGASPTYIALCSFAAVWSIGVGGNLPVDSAVFLG